MSAARYRLLDADDVASLSPQERAKYEAERARFDREVLVHRAHIFEHGWLDVAPLGKREARYHVRPFIAQVGVRVLAWLLGPALRGAR